MRLKVGFNNETGLASLAIPKEYFPSTTGSDYTHILLTSITSYQVIGAVRHPNGKLTNEGYIEIKTQNNIQQNLPETIRLPLESIGTSTPYSAIGLMDDLMMTIVDYQKEKADIFFAHHKRLEEQALKI